MTEAEINEAHALLRARKQAMADIDRLDKFKARGLVKLFGERTDGKEDHILFYPEGDESAVLINMLIAALWERTKLHDARLAELGVTAEG